MLVVEKHGRRLQACLEYVIVQKQGTAHQLAVDLIAVLIGRTLAVILQHVPVGAVYILKTGRCAPVRYARHLSLDLLQCLLEMCAEQQFPDVLRTLLYVFLYTHNKETAGVLLPRFQIY